MVGNDDVVVVVTLMMVDEIAVWMQDGRIHS